MGLDRWPPEPICEMSASHLLSRGTHYLVPEAQLGRTEAQIQALWKNQCAIHWG